MPSDALDCREPAPPKVHLPGEPGIWIFVIGELAIFGLLSGFFLAAKKGALADFTAAQAQLHPYAGQANTLLLITSSWLVASAMNSMRKGMARQSANFLKLAILCAICFLCLKSLEYYSYLHIDRHTYENQMFMYYFAMTGIHFLHVIVAIALMSIFLLKKQIETHTGVNMFFECCATYWHMVDIIWLILYTIFYIL